MRLGRVFSSLSTGRLMTLILLLCVFIMAARPITDPDFWWHLRTGQHIVDTKSIPHEDIFSYTQPGRAWITHEWLAEIVLYAIYVLSGEAGLILVFAGIITAAFALLYLQCGGRPYLASFVVVWGAITSALTWGVRPQMFSLLLSSAFLYILHLYRHGKRWQVWLLPPLMVLWANLHGSFYLGLIFPSVYIVGAAMENVLAGSKETSLPWRDVRRLLLVTLITAVAPILNPNGVQILIYPFGTLGSPTMQRYIMEWFSPDFHLAQFQPFAVYILVLLASLGLSRRAPNPIQSIFMLGFGYASLRSARHIPFFVLTTAPLLTDQILRAWRGWKWTERFRTRPVPRGPKTFVVNWLLLGLVLLGGAAQASHTLTGNAAAQRETFPVAAVDFLESSQTTGHAYNLYHWGGYLIWRLYPERKVFIDGRADVYGDQFIEEYLQVYQLSSTWQEPLDRYGVDVAIIDTGSSLATMLSERVDWYRAYADEQAVIFFRQEGG
jgi:hypothetical protein